MNDNTDMSGLVGDEKARQLVVEGMPVYDLNGDKVGTVAALDTENDGFIVEKGLLFVHDIPIPMSAVAGANADGIYLNVSKDDAQNGNWGDTATSTVDTTTGTTATVDTETPYLADAAQSVGTDDLDVTTAEVGDETYPLNPPTSDDESLNR